jgi:Cu(I)/Ag(I) efflux system membrane fusion protein
MTLMLRTSFGRHRRPARLWVWLVVILGVLVAGAGAGIWGTWYWGIRQAAPAGSAGGAAAAGGNERRILYWRAPMDPSYISNRPGKSPMGMDLVPVYADEAGAAGQGMITIDPVTIQNMGIRTAIITSGPLVKTIRTLGRVDYDEQTVTYIDTKFDGWIEKLYVDETGMPVQQGDPLFEVYSPKLYSAQEEYLAALRGVERLSESTVPEARRDAERLVEAARVQLRYFDISDRQIDALQRTKEIQKTLMIHSPASGIVTEKMALEGMYVTPGMRLYTIADLFKVWVLVDVYEYQLPWVRIDQQAKMTLPYIPGKEFVGRVVYIYPYLEQQTRVVHVRLEFENPALELKPAMYANVSIDADLGRVVPLIPRVAYIDSGTRKVAFLDLGDGKFLPRDIEVGVEGEDGMVEVRQGLVVGERVVTSGQFLLDSESNLRAAIAKMLEPNEPAAVMSEPSTAPARMHGPAPQSRSVPADVVASVDALFSHYLEIQQRLASDHVTDVAAQARALVAAADGLVKQLGRPEAHLPAELGKAVDALRSAAAGMHGQSLEEDRANFAALSAAMRTLVQDVRPETARYPKIYIYHCPMSKGDWLQVSDDMANPYYGFKMRKCGQLQATE